MPQNSATHTSLTVSSTQQEKKAVPAVPETKSSPAEDNKKIIRKLIIVFILAAIFMGIEIGGGILAGSIAILSDAAHMLSDLLGFVISIVSVYISGFKASKKHSYGFHRAGVIGALASVIVIWILSGFLIYFAIIRMINIHKVEVEGPLMFGIACFGLLTNLVMVKVLHSGHGHGCGHGHSHDHSHSHSHSHSHGHSHDHGHSHSHKKKKSKKEEEHKHSSDKKCTHKHDEEVKELEMQPTAHKHAENCDDHHHHEHKENEHHHSHSHSHSHVHDEKESHNHEHKSDEKSITLDKEQNKIENQENAITLSKEANHHHHHHSCDHDHKEGSEAAPKNLSKPADKDNLNIRATVIHILGDILQSIGVIIASILIWISPDKLKIVDPILTFIFAIIVLCTTLRVARDCIFVLMEGTPMELDHDDFEEKLKKVEGVSGLHDLHVWSLGVGKPAMSAHVYTNSDLASVLKKTTEVCRSFGILHTTIQIETTTDEENENFVNCEHNIH